MLSALYSGRIDLGIGRAAGTTRAVAQALQRDRAPYPAGRFFASRWRNCWGTFAGRRFESPEVWLLGSSGQSAVWAAEMGLPYAYADFINPFGRGSSAYYRQHFEPSAGLASPRTAVAVAAICAETDDEALRLPPACG